MKEEKQKIYLEKREKIRWFYHNTDCSIEQIGKHFDISATTANHMIEGKGEPKFIQALIEKGELEA